ncbi:probable polygalacturonase [Tanacetum coccineum]
MWHASPRCSDLLVRRMLLNAAEGFLMILLLSLCCTSFCPNTANAAIFDVTTYGAKGDGITDDTQAFIHAWAGLCGDTTLNPTLVIPPDMTFLVTTVIFNGSSCISPTLNIKILGNITAPTTLDGWKDCEAKQFWIYVTMVQGLTIDGPGQIDGQGSTWWRNEATTATCDRPSVVHFYLCKNLRVNGTRHINSPFLHISINNCEDVDIGYLQIIAPADSPNTDGIDVSGSSRINIHDCDIQTGDDCVAINGGVVDMNVTGVLCGPGHGISIGSLGENGSHDTVEQVRIQNCNITGTANGLRIKTAPDGTGYARGILFQDIYLENVLNPIIIDQHYCLSSTYTNCLVPNSETGVQVSDVTYMNIYGTSASHRAITFNCSETLKCTNIVTKNVQITGGEVAYCKNVVGEFADTNPSVSCD